MVSEYPTKRPTTAVRLVLKNGPEANSKRTAKRRRLSALRYQCLRSAVVSGDKTPQATLTSSVRYKDRTQTSKSIQAEIFWHLPWMNEVGGTCSTATIVPCMEGERKPFFLNLECNRITRSRWFRCSNEPKNSEFPPTTLVFLASFGGPQVFHFE